MDDTRRTRIYVCTVASVANRTAHSVVGPEPCCGGRGGHRIGIYVHPGVREHTSHCWIDVFATEAQRGSTL